MSKEQPTRRPTTVWRISFGMVCLSLSVYLVARSLGIMPDPLGAVLAGRVALCEALAINCSEAAERRDFASVRRSLKSIHKRNPDMLSAGLRTPDGRLEVEVGEHRGHWATRPETVAAGHSTPTHLLVPLMAGNQAWATLEICFRDPAPRDPLGWFALADVRMVLFLAVGSGVSFSLYLRKVLSHLDPSKVVPPRVRNTLNTLAEGLLVLDAQDRIVLSNEAFAKALGTTGPALQGHAVAEFPWLRGAEEAAEFPWTRAVRERTTVTGATLKLESPASGLRTFRVNCTPLFSDETTCIGALASFDDVTLLEERNATLGATLKKLKHSRDLIRQQNEQLHLLATRDALTGCLNRRALFEELEQQYAAVQNAGVALSCLLVDIDHFKAINDNHGHQKGDEVLRMVGGVLDALAGGAIAGRYGGEEFCILLPGVKLDEACRRAEEIRAAIAQGEAAGLRITASLGVTCASLGAAGPQEIVEQADRALYAAKRAGRNRVVRWDQAVENAAELVEADLQRLSRAVKAVTAGPLNEDAALDAAAAPPARASR